MAKLQQKKSESCKYCVADDEGCVTCLDNRGRLWLSNNKLVVQFDESMNEIDIRFCPICGRRLI